MFPTSNKLFAAVLVSILAAVSLSACKGDVVTSIFLTGQATFPPESALSLGEVTPVANTPFQVLDLARASGDELVAAGTTDASGNYAVTIAPSPVVAVVVLGEVRVSGLIDARNGDSQKSFNGITDIACEAGVGAIAAGLVDVPDMTSARIANLEAGAAKVLQEQEIDFSDLEGSVVPAAQRVLELTSNGANPPA